jgi:hypothetical protein
VTEVYRLSINLPAFEFRLAQNIQRIAHCVAAGSAAPSGPLVQPLQLHGEVIAYEFAPPVVWSEVDAVAEYQLWILLNGFRELAELMTHFLSSIHSVAATATLQELQAIHGHLTPAQWQEVVIVGERHFEKANLPDKLRLLTSDDGLMLGDEAMTHIKSLYAVRNCLVHRGGLVQKTDVKNAGGLHASWLTMRPYVATGKQEAPLRLPHVMSGPGHVVIKSELSSKEFPLGSRIVFTAPEFNDIAYGTFMVGKMAVAALEQRLRDSGIRMSNPDAPSA